MRKRNKAVYIRMNDAEYDQLLSKVAESGVSIQSYMVSAALGAHLTTAQEMAALNDQNRLFADMDKQLRGMGTNLNQLAHTANATGSLPSHRQLEELGDEVSELRKELGNIWRSTRLSISPQNLTGQ